MLTRNARAATVYDVCLWALQLPPPTHRMAALLAEHEVTGAMLLKLSNNQLQARRLNNPSSLNPAILSSFLVLARARLRLVGSVCLVWASPWACTMRTVRV